MIVVTGGAGFIGSNLVAGLELAGGELATPIVVCDRFGCDDKWRNLAKRELRALVPPERLFAFLDENLDQIKTIYHLGAISATTERDVDLIVETNFVLSVALWHWCARHRIRFIYASSAASYGDGACGFDDDGRPRALALLRPLNPYGWSKHAFDRFVVRTVAEGGAAPPQWAGLKFFNVYGPNEYHKGDMASVIFKLYPVIRSGAPARLFKSHRSDFVDGGQSRDFIWVGDCVSVMLWLGATPAVCGLFNVGTGQARSFKDLALATFAAAGIAPNIEYIDMPEHLRDRYQYFTQAAMARLRLAGYHTPFTTLEDGVGAYVADYLSASDPYR
ncbi:MAG: ADP-glyceromanno-heptose 6-epimerase [Rhodospirillaceae bacterium]